MDKIDQPDHKQNYTHLLIQFIAGTFQVLRTEQWRNTVLAPHGTDFLEQGELSDRKQEFPDGKLNTSHCRPQTLGLPGS